jgi:hypothetical protein
MFVKMYISEGIAICMFHRVEFRVVSCEICIVGSSVSFNCSRVNLWFGFKDHVSYQEEICGGGKINIIIKLN